MSTKSRYDILIVEDEAPLREALAFKFKAERLSVATAKNGKEGLEIALQNHPKIILLDIIMPIMNGLDMLKNLRKDEWGKSASVILLTNVGSNNEIEQAIGEGVFDYIIKTDWQIEDVVNKVKAKL